MSNLKELTWEHHKEAERQDYVKVLMSGKINPRFYATYLWNQHKKYDILEALAGAVGLLDDLPDIRRKVKIEQDFLELWDLDRQPVIVESTSRICRKNAYTDSEPTNLWPCICNTWAIRSGGQMIQKIIEKEECMTI